MSESHELKGIASPEWEYWLRREECDIHEGAALLADVEPRSKSGQRIIKALSLRDIETSADPVQFARRSAGDYTDTRLSEAEATLFLRALEISSNAWAAVRRGNLEEEGGRIEPRRFIRWAQGKGYVLPESIERASAREREEDLAKHWRPTQLWTIFETAFLLSGEKPPALAVSADSLKGNVAVWYRHLKDAITLRQIRIYGQRSEGFGNQLLKPCDIATWAWDHQLAIPEWIEGIAPSLPSRDELNARISELEQRLAKQPPGAHPEPDKELEPGERKTLDTLGAYFARRYQYDPTRQRNDATGKVREELERHGVPLDDKTIRDLMRDGCTRFRDDRKKA